MKKDILKYIQQWKPYQQLFQEGFCYQFARMLQVNYGGVIYSNGDHCVLRIGSYFYDSQGAINFTEAEERRYKIIDRSDERRYQEYENFII